VEMWTWTTAITLPLWHRLVPLKPKLQTKISVLRDAAHLEAKILCNLPIGTKVEWIADDDWGWSKIKYNGKIGYVQNTRISGKKRTFQI